MDLAPKLSLSTTQRTGRNLQRQAINPLTGATANMEDLADIIGNGLVNIGREFVDLDVRLSETTRVFLCALASQVILAVEGIIKSIRENS